MSFCIDTVQSTADSYERNAMIGMFKHTQIMYCNTLGSAYTSAHTCLCDFIPINSLTKFIELLICLKINLHARMQKSKI